jgi:hypothetical protein
LRSHSRPRFQRAGSGRGGSAARLLAAAGWLLAAAAPVAADFGLYAPPDDPSELTTGWSPSSQFLLRPNTQMTYTNLGWLRYQEAGGGFSWFPAYDQLGEPWLNGSTSMFTWTEDRTRSPVFGSYFYKEMERHNRLVIARESFAGGGLRLSVGEAMRTTFTSLTLDMARFTGVRVDAVLGSDQEFTALFSRPSDPRQRLRLNWQGTYLNDQGTLLGAGHWEGRFLDGALFLGGTLINHHRFDSMQESGDFLRGTMPAEMVPDTVSVRISDDSPRSAASGASLYGGSMSVTVRGGSGENRVLTGIVPLLVVSDQARWVDGHWSVAGDQYVEQVLPVPDGAVGVSASATVSEDYAIGTRQTHQALDRTTVEVKTRQTPLVTRARASDNGPAAADTVAVGVDYGLSSALDLAGVNGALGLGSMDLEWEYVRSTAFFQFPREQLGTRSSLSGGAAYVRGAQNWRPVSLGAELFSISPRFNSYALDSGDYRLGDPIVATNDDYITREFMGNDLSFYFNEARPNAYRSGNAKRNKAFSLVEDNDDEDQYEDQGQDDQPLTERTQPSEAGVYPGWDLNQDGVPDYNRNRNGIPDYLEPFLRFEQEEQAFYWGDDFNNNAVLDYFEDDALPDYPYYKDERGLHAFAEWRPPLEGLGLRVGRFHIDQIAGTGRNHVTYGSASFRRSMPGHARLQGEGQVKRVWDDIPNATYQYQLVEGSTDTEGDYESVFVADSLTMRNSLVCRGYLGTQWTPLRALRLRGNLRFERNHQYAAELGDGVTQDPRDLNTVALVGKTDYALAWHRFLLRPMLKYSRLREDRQGGTGAGGADVRRDERQRVPICRLDCRFTDRTSIELGAEGVPGLGARLVDGRNPLADYTSQTYLGQLKRRGVSSGFSVFLIAGVQYTRKEYDDPSLPSGSYVRSFFQVFMGEQILAASQ